MAEQLLLDPTSEDAANAQLDITGTGYGLLEHHYPQPPVAAQWASSVDTEGSRLGSVKHENRQIQITLDVDGLTALRALQAKLGKLHREGGTLKRTLSDATVIVFDVLTVEGYDPEFSYTFDLATVTPMSFTLTCLPYGRAPEVDMGDNVETTNPWLKFTDTGVKGDMPALGRLVVDNDSANPQSLMVWGLRSRYYSSASTAALTYQAESCAKFATPALAVGAAGASGGGSNVVRHSSVGDSPGWNGLIYVGASSTAQTHVGGYRIYTRVYVPATNTGTVSVRLRWQPYVGSGIVTNTAVPITYASAPAEGWWLLIDLGMVSIPLATVGTQGWLGWIEGTSTVNTDDLDVDYVMLVPADEGYGVVIGGTAREIRANGSVRLTDRDVLQSALTAGYWTKPLRYEGDYLRVPPAGAELRTTEMIVKFVAGQDSAGLNSPVVYEPPVSGDPTIDDISARLFVTPRYLVVPSA